MKRAELLARLLVLAGLLTVVGVPLAVWGQTPLLHARMPEAGGWSVDSLAATVGVPLRLRLTSDDVVHGFAVGRHDLPAVDVLPGKVTEVDLTFETPGTYTFYCTRWCGLNHWRMRGVIEVAAAPGAVQAAPAATSPLYVALGLDLDAPRRASATPAVKPVAAIPERQLPSAMAPYTSTAYYRTHAPANLWTDLRGDSSFRSLDDRRLWDLTASIWRANTASTALSEGRDIFARNCAACHGERGAGDGTFAEDLAAAAPSHTSPEAGMLQRPADFTDSERMLAASPALLQGKILRGGMGTGMPSWGPIFTDEQLWNLVAYIYTFQFEYR